MYILSDFGRGGGGRGPNTAFAFLPATRNVNAMPFHQASDGKEVAEHKMSPLMQFTPPDSQTISIQWSENEYREHLQGS